MSKLIYSHFLFICMLLFHVVSNKEKFYIEHNQNTFEFTLYNNPSSQKFKKLLKDNNNAYEDQIEITSQMIAIDVLPGLPTSDSEEYIEYNPGSIIYARQSCIITLQQSYHQSHVKIGQINQPQAFVSYAAFQIRISDNLKFLYIMKEEMESQKLGRYLKER